MKWLVDFLVSSIGQKLIVTLTGLFLIVFLVAHLAGNLQLLKNDGGESFNLYTDFMGHNPIIQTVAKGLYAFILIHAIQGILLARKNKKARGKAYAVKTKDNSSWASKHMTLLGLLIFAFLMIHMGDFWFKFKFASESVPSVTYDGRVMHDAFAQVYMSFGSLPVVIAYLVGMLALAFHLNHGFTAAFQSMGLRHKNYTPILEVVGLIYSILVPAIFAIIPLYIYFIQL